MHRFFVTDLPLEIGARVDLRSIHHQLWRVLRAQPGDRIQLLDGGGNEYLTELDEIGGSRAIGHVVQASKSAGDPRVHVALYQCVLKGERMEWVLQKGTELGVSQFVPVISERTIVRPASKVARKIERWHAIVREAAEQSGRGSIPEVASPLAWHAALGDGACGEHGVRLVPWERTAGQLSLAATLEELRGTEAPPPRVSLLIGPEGGISDAEMQLASALGWQSVTLGPRVLRAETAALAAVTILMSVLGEMV